MKKKTPFLDFYNRCVESREIPSCGLCHSFNDMNPLPIFEPTYTEIPNEDVRRGYWGYNGENVLDESVSSNYRAYTFTPLRQTIVLFCAAINNEL